MLFAMSATSSAFVTQPPVQVSQTRTTLFMSTPMPDPERMKQIMEEEARNPQNMKASANMLKNLKPEDIDGMLREMDNMPEAQKKQLEAMGMNPAMMRQSMEMMKANPAMAKQMANMMESMTPEEMMEKSRQAQANFANMGMESPAAPSSQPAVVDAEVVKSEDEDVDEDDDDEAEAEPVPLPDADVLDTLYKTAEIMSDGLGGKVTFAGFSSIPPIALLIGNDSERDLSKKELKECWADGSLGSTRVDRVGFERVLTEVQEYFTLPILEKARERTTIPQKRGATKSKPTSSSTSSQPSAVAQPYGSGPQVGQDIPAEILEQQVKNMSDTDMDTMLQQMQNLTPEQEARMKAMGVDPKMMQKTASLMNSNPLMKGAAKMMMKNMSADQMKQASQQAQEQMSKMSPEEIEKAYEELEKRTNGK